jgi:hypothetical protein
MAVVGRRVRDDRVLTETRVLGAAIVPFLLVAFGLLYLFPDDTRHWFAWDVQPTITPLIMGAGYVAGAYFFVRVALETRWHRIQVARERANRSTSQPTSRAGHRRLRAVPRRDWARR